MGYGLKIDYSLPENSYNKLYIDAPFRYGIRHISLSVLDSLNKLELTSTLEKVYHFVIGFIELIPVLGHIIAFLDCKLNKREIKVIYIRSTDPYKMGIEQGKALSGQIRYLSKRVLPIMVKAAIVQGIDPYQKSKDLEKHIPEDYIKEMKGVAKGSGVSYETILLSNTIADIMCLFGCSLLGLVSKKDYPPQKLIATNHFTSVKYDIANINDSYPRYQKLFQRIIENTTKSIKEALREVNAWDTILSVVFDVNKLSFEMTNGWLFSAENSYKRFSSERLFKIKSKDLPKNTTGKVVRLGRNFDWPMVVLGSNDNLVVIVRPAAEGKKKTAIIGFPGQIGAYTGMNEEGLCLAISIVPSSFTDGTPNFLIFRKLLEESETTKRALNRINLMKLSSSMNLLLAGKDGIAKLEIDPTKQPRGAYTVMEMT